MLSGPAAGALGAALEDALQGDLPLGHPLGHAGGDAGAVVDGQPDVIAAFVPLHLDPLAGAHRRRRHPEGRADDTARNVGDVGDHCGSRRLAAGARADQRQLADRVGRW